VKNSGASGGVSWCGVLLTVFITLKLCGLIDWSWCSVFAPLWLPAAIYLLLVIYVVLAMWIADRNRGRKERK
jgi:hypothetical protein